MSWLLSLLVAFLSGLAGLLAAGIVASLLVSWYRISSFEGGSGYFVVGTAIVGLIVGGLIGIVVARLMANGPSPVFLRALGASVGVIVLAAVTIGALARVSADVAPQSDGQSLLLAVEFRWPEAARDKPGQQGGVGYTRLGSVSGGTLRKSEDGPLFLDLARQEQGRWIVPGVVDIFTTRGEPTLDLGLGTSRLAGFLMPSKSALSAPMADWSDWLPVAKPGTQPLPDQFAYRYRVQRSSQPMRVDQVGAFTVETVGSGFSRSASDGPFSAPTLFRIAYRGKALTAHQNAKAVSVVAHQTPTLLVQTDDVQAPAQCLLLSEGDAAVKLQVLGACSATTAPLPLTADVARHEAARSRDGARGWLDRQSFGTPGLYLLGPVVLDTRDLSHRAVTEPQEPWRIDGLPPATLSPDEGSFAWFTHQGDDQHPVLGVTNWRSDLHYTVPIDRVRMRYHRYDDIGPAWVAHHFTWERGSDGAQRLTARTDFKPLPYRGRLDGGSYTLRPAGKALRQALVEVLVSQLAAQRLPDEMDGFYLVVRIDGKVVRAATGDTDPYLSFQMDHGSVDPLLMTRVAKTLDAAIATGAFDAMFHRDAP